MSETNTRTYEVGFILAPTVAETEVAASVDALKAIITKAEGAIGAEQAPEFIDLAYTMEKSIASKKMKYSQGYFGWIKFEATPEAIEAIKKAFDGVLELVRYIIVKSHADNAVVFRKPKIEAVRALADDSGIDEGLLDEPMDDDLKEDHEMLPDLAADIDDTGSVAEEGEEAESKD